MPPATRARPDVQCLVDFRYAPVALFAARSIPLPDGNSSCFHGGARLREGVSIRRKRHEGRLHWRMPTPPPAHNSCPRVAARYLVIEVAGDAADRLRAVRVTGSPRTPSSRSRRSSSTVASPRPLWPPHELRSAIYCRGQSSPARSRQPRPAHHSRQDVFVDPARARPSNHTILYPVGAIANIVESTYLSLAAPMLRPMRTR
jgi:hypothetical protein